MRKVFDNFDATRRAAIDICGLGGYCFGVRPAALVTTLATLCLRQQGVECLSKFVV